MQIASGLVQKLRQSLCFPKSCLRNAVLRSFQMALTFSGFNLSLRQGSAFGRRLAYRNGTKLEFREPLDDPRYQIQAIKVDGIYIADRNLLYSISWDELNRQGFGYIALLKCCPRSSHHLRSSSLTCRGLKQRKTVRGTVHCYMQKNRGGSVKTKSCPDGQLFVILGIVFVSGNLIFEFCEIAWRKYCTGSLM